MRASWWTASASLARTKGLSNHIIVRHREQRLQDHDKLIIAVLARLFPAISPSFPHLCCHTSTASVHAMNYPSLDTPSTASPGSPKLIIAVFARLSPRFPVLAAILQGDVVRHRVGRIVTPLPHSSLAGIITPAGSWTPGGDS